MTKPVPENVPHFLRAWRKYRRMSQKKLALLAGYAEGKSVHSGLSRVETGEHELMQNKIVRFADALGIRPSDLFLDPSSAEYRALKRYRDLPPQLQRVADQQLQEIEEDAARLAVEEARNPRPSARRDRDSPPKLQRTADRRMEKLEREPAVGAVERAQNPTKIKKAGASRDNRRGLPRKK